MISTSSLETYLTNLFQKNLRRNIITNRNVNRKEIHASSLIHNCIRSVMIELKLGSLNKPKPISTATALTFAIGNKLEEIVLQNTNGVKPKALGIKIKDILLVGSPDLIVDNKYIIECKSTSRESFLALNAPYPKHVTQLMFYLWIAQKHKMPYSTTGAIVYVPKQEVKQPVIKVFAQSLQDTYIDLFNSYINTIKQSVETGKLPERTCSSVSSYFAKKCPVCHYCFYGSSQ